MNNVVLLGARKAPAKEPVSRGALRTEVYREASPGWFSPEEHFLFRMTEMIDSFISIELHLIGREEVRRMHEFCKESARARQLTFEYHNRTGHKELNLTEPAAQATPLFK